MIKNFSEINKTDVESAGGKAASLGELTQAGFPVPEGFVIPVEIFKTYFNQPFPAELQEEIFQGFDLLNCERVAVRSSAVSEDSPGASWAGQLESYLNVGKDDLIEKIRQCWHSIKSERALAYAGEHDFNEDDLAVAVVVQKMVESEVSGVMFTVNPIIKGPDEMMIDAGFGLGEYLVQGVISPDNFLVDKNSLEIKSKNIQNQEKMLVFKDGQNQEVPLDQEIGSKSALSDEQVRELAQIGKNIESHYGKPQDIEWAIENGKIYLLQARPITVLP
jgi:phosphoenolpyruvate synthase/pyruvate phosphate dikinase